MPGTTLYLQRDQIFGLYCNLPAPDAETIMQALLDEGVYFSRFDESAARLGDAGGVTIVFHDLSEHYDSVEEGIRAAGFEVSLDRKVPPHRVRYGPPCDRLLELGSDPVDGGGDFVYDVSNADIPELIAMFEDAELEVSVSPMAWAPFHALKALGQLKAEAAIPVLMRRLENMKLEDDAEDPLDYELGGVLCEIGVASFGPLVGVVRNPTLSQASRITACEALGNLADRVPGIREDCCTLLAHMIADRQQAAASVNGWVLVVLMRFKASAHAEVVRQAFEEGRIDPSIAGDWEDAQIAFGLRSERSRPRKPMFVPADDPDTPLPGPESGRPYVRSAPKVGRNDSCPCGSGKKYKKCCGA